ncbi:protein disulfide isomerase-like 1-3 [Citrus sinensis]|nr:protein disulfide isomerase-like 1-3 [Citrus sinensis]
MLSTTIFLLFILFRLSPFCVYKIDYDGGYVLCVSVFKKLPPISYGNTVELSDSYNSFNDQKHKLPPAIDEKEDVVVKLSDKNFNHVIAKNQHVMVLFYAPWSPQSKKLAPEYEAAATELKGKSVLAKVNAMSVIELAKKWRIQAYPTVYFFVNGVRVNTYYYSRTKDAIVNYIKTKMSGDLYTLMKIEKAEHLLTAESTIALGFLDSLKGTENEKLAAASKLHPDVIFFQTTRADVAKMFLIDPEIKRPALIPPMITYTRETAALILDSRLQELWLFATVHDSETKSIFQEAAKAFKGKVIAVNGFFNGEKYVLNGELTLSNIKSFALDFLEDKLRSQQSDTTLLENKKGY